MSYLHIDLVAPISLLALALVGVALVRALVGVGERRATDKTRRVLAEHRLWSDDDNPHSSRTNE